MRYKICLPKRIWLQNGLAKQSFLLTARHAPALEQLKLACKILCETVQSEVFSSVNKKQNTGVVP